MTERIQRLHELCKERGLNMMPTHFLADLHGSALGKFSALPHMEKASKTKRFLPTRKIESAAEFTSLRKLLLRNVVQSWIAIPPPLRNSRRTAPK